MPTALQLQREHAADLQVLFVDRQGDDLAGVEQAALSYQWFGTGAMWTTTSPVLPPENSIPQCVVLDRDGKVALWGHPMEIEEELDALLNAAEIARTTPPPTLPAALHPAWRALQNGDLQQAALASRFDDEEDDEARRELRGRIDARLDSAVVRLERMVNDGELLAASELAAKLAPVHAGAAKWHERLRGEEFATELKAATELRELLQPLLEDGIDPGLAAGFDALAATYPGTAAAARATRYATVCREG